MSQPILLCKQWKQQVKQSAEVGEEKVSPLVEPELVDLVGLEEEVAHRLEEAAKVSEEEEENKSVICK